VTLQEPLTGEVADRDRTGGEEEREPCLQRGQAEAGAEVARFRALLRDLARPDPG
jgi:hypothetical protein